MNDLRGIYLDKADKAEKETDKTTLETNAEAITTLINEIKSKESNDQLKGIYNNF